MKNKNALWIRVLAWVLSILMVVSIAYLAIDALVDLIPEPEKQENTTDSSESADDHEGHDHSADEHVWTSLRNVKAISLEIEEAFASASPEDADYFSACAQDFIAELDALDASFAAAAEASNRKSIVFADRFPFVHLMHDYHIPYVAAFSGCSSEVNASFETQIKLIEAVRKDNLGYVLTTEGNGKSLAKSVSTETGCLVRSLDSLQSVTREDIESGVTYLDVMRKNLSVIKEVLS